MSEFIKPADGVITCDYNCHRNRPLGPGNRIFGVDIAKAGIFRKPALAMKAGTVTFSGRAGGAGNMVEMGHGDCYSRYLHLDELVWDVGTVLPQGAMVGLIGNTGDSTGPHLHVDLRFKTQEAARRIMEPELDSQPWGWNVDPSVAWSAAPEEPQRPVTEEDEMQHYMLYQAKDSGQAYRYLDDLAKVKKIGPAEREVIRSSAGEKKVTLTEISTFTAGDIESIGLVR